MALRETVKIIFDIIHDLANAPDGISRGEIASKHRISAGTAHKYIGIIEDMGIPIRSEGQRYYVVEGYSFDLRLTAEEGEFLFLALERALTTYTAQSQVARTLIDKLAHKLHPHLGGGLRERLRSEQSNLEAARIFITLVQAKRLRREVWVDYFPLKRAQASRWRIRPYRFVSNPLSDGFYVLCEGKRDERNYIGLSLKFDRIQDVQLTDKPFEISDQARFQSHFGQSWGVWSSGRDPVRIVLRFEPRHYDRLLESIWHPSQSIHTDADGYVLYSANVSEPEEMVPWIRSWGSGVVVEEPEQLRRRVIRSLRRQMRQYGLAFDSGAGRESPLHLLWAKYERKTGDYHLLLYHLLDVAAVATCLWDQVLGAGRKTWLQELLGLEADPTRQLLALLAGAHDIGKATPNFQKKAKDLYDELGDFGLHECSDNTLHGVLSAVILRRWFIGKGISKPQATQLAAIIGGHHGNWISSAETKDKRAGKERWRDLQDQLCQELQNVLDVAEITLPPPGEQFNVFAAFLSGFVSVCDWIGSDERYFEYEEERSDSAAYFQRSQEQAEQALRELGWAGWDGDDSNPAFDTAFRYLADSFAANALQREAIAHLQGFEQPPRLILVEYLTGSGKTELALHIGDQLVNHFGLSGTYIAMPTQATSNQMFERVGEYLQARYPKDNINLLLAHGQAEQYQQSQQMRSDANQEGNESAEAAKSWFEQNRKRALLTPYAVGTIDQAMLSVLQAKHHFVRQFGLSRKMIIFDEIHSYDTYMNTIIERLFNWLRALDSPMILLSATLSRQNRQEILRAVGTAVDDEMADVRYPRLTVVQHDGAVQVHELPKPDSRTVRIQRIPPDLDSLLNEVLARYEQGGCIAIVCNTVNESIEVAGHLREAEGIEQDEVWLFHARFPPVWRAEIEEKVLDTFGKERDATGPDRAILVATQIIEQSLDLDFDLMISRTAPIDLLIQRVGRLHRHQRDDRPAHLAKPTLLLRRPEMGGDSLPDFGVDEAIYERFFLLKTWLKLREMSELRSPDDIDGLMDFVYSDDVEGAGIDDAYRGALEAALDDMKLGDANSAFRGKQYVIGKPADEEMIDSNSFKLSDDERHVSTRDAQPGIDIICITEPQIEKLLERVPSKNEVSTLLQYKVTVRGYKLLCALDKLPEHRKWAKKPKLRSARAVIFADGRYEVPDSPYILQLTRGYGLQIINEEEA